MPLRHLAALVCLCLALFLPGLASVPPMDRDESRFVQATKQMIETGDYVDIRFQDTPRYKKPAGIYWLQAGSVKLFAGGDTSALWAYRLPSMTAAILAVLLTYLTAALFLPPPGAALAATFLATSVLLTGEAHLAKSDAALLATVMAGQYVLARLYAGRPSAWLWPLFWGAVGAGILVKGPVMPMLAGLTVLALGLWNREWRWLKPLNPLFGAPLALAIALPWLIAITLKSDGGFVGESVGADLLPKLMGGQERHGGWPGYYLLLATLTFWPASLFLWPAVAAAWQARGEGPVRFLAAWIVPFWLLFELIPTKLPHYVLPTYPALAILCAAAILDAGDEARAALGQLFGRTWTRIYAVFWAVFSAALGVGIVSAAAHLLGAGTFEDPPPAPILGLGLCLAATGLLAALGVLRVALRATIFAIAFGAAGSYFLLFEGAFPEMRPLWVSSELAKAIEGAAADRDVPAALAGYSEPSAVFLLGTRTGLGDGADAARHLVGHPGAAVAIESRQRQAFLDAAAGLGLAVKAVDRVEGLNYSNGKKVALEIFVRAAP